VHAGGREGKENDRLQQLGKVELLGWALNKCLHAVVLLFLFGDVRKESKDTNVEHVISGCPRLGDPQSNLEESVVLVPVYSI